MAFCQNVQTFCAAQVIYWTGMNGVDYVFNIFIADTSLMQNRLIWMSFTGLPYVVNTFAGPELGETYLTYSTWRWGYGSFAILTPVFSLSFWAVFWLMGMRARRSGVEGRSPSSRTVFQGIKHWCIEFDGKSYLPSKHESLLTCHSGWPPARSWRLFPPSSSLASCILPEEGFRVSNGPVHDRLRTLAYRSLRCLGALLRHQDLLSILSHEKPFGYCGMPARRQFLDHFLVSLPAVGEYLC